MQISHSFLTQSSATHKSISNFPKDSIGELLSEKLTAAAASGRLNELKTTTTHQHLLLCWSCAM